MSCAIFVFTEVTTTLVILYVIITVTVLFSLGTKYDFGTVVYNYVYVAPNIVLEIYLHLLLPYFNSTVNI